MGVRLTTNDIRAACRLVGECRDVGADANAWQLRLLDGLRALTGAVVGISGNFEHVKRGKKPASYGSVRLGWPDARSERAWLEYTSDTPWERTPEFSRLILNYSEETTRTRDEIWGRQAWYRSDTFNRRHKASGIDDYIISIRAVPGQDLCHSLWLHRAVGDKPFTRREVEILNIVHAEIARLIGGSIATAREPKMSDLSARQREVLYRLLGGDSEKQAARALGVSVPTLHEYVGVVYKHYGASSRAELMAKFVGRGVGARNT